MSQDRIHIRPIEPTHHNKVGSAMGTNFKRKGHKLGEATIKKTEIEYDED
jgi:hypothetical protein